MSLTRDEMMLLMQYADGELEGEANASDAMMAKALLSTNKEAAAFRDEMERLGAWTRIAEASAVASFDGAASFDVADAVMDQIDAVDARNAETTKTKTVPPLSKEAEKEAEKRVAPIASLDAAREKRRRVGVVVATALALAAGIALVVRSHPEGGDPNRTAALTPKVIDTVAEPTKHPENLVNPVASEAQLAVENAAANANEPGVEVNVSDATENGVSVFYLPGSNSAGASAVVWFSDSPGDNK